MTVKQWFAEASLVAAWRDTLAQPHMQEGLALLRDLALPRPKECPLGVDLIHWHALANAQREGFVMCLQAIDKLSRVPERPETDGKTTPSWGEVDLSAPPNSTSPAKQTT